MTDIIAVSDIASDLGVTFEAADEALAERLRKSVESMARQYVRWAITSDEYEHILPGRGPVGRILPLPIPFVTEVESVWENSASVGGQEDDPFPDDTLLTVGVDYYLDYADSQFGSFEGHLVRRGRNWCSVNRSVKVSYTAGLTDEQLDGDYYFVKDAIICETVERLKYAKSRQGSGSTIGGDVGPIESERLKDYAVKYTSNATRTIERSARQLPASGLLPETELKLNGIMSFYDWFY